MPDYSLRFLALAALAVLPGLPADARELGDFGRVKPGVMNEQVVPFFERNSGVLLGAPSSDFNWTDQEVEMHQRLWRFLVSPHPSGWAFEELLDPYSKQPTQRYYRWLRGRENASSRVRYNTMADDIGSDLGTLSGAFRSICAVQEVDRQRRVAADGLDGLEPEILGEQQARKAENAEHVGRFVSALSQRYDAYGYALDHLLVETPHEEALEVDARLSELAGWVDRAEAGDFCGDGWGPHQNAGAAIPGRLLRGEPSEGEYRK